MNICRQCKVKEALNLYCSHECQWESMRGSKRPKEWYEKRGYVRPWNKGVGIPKKKEYQLVDGQRCIKIPLTKGKYAIIDEEDFSKVNKYKWHLTTSENKRFYAKTSIWLSSIKKNKEVKMHRYILGLGDKFPPVDHKNGDGLDNRRQNLRVATFSQNVMNSKKPNKNGFKGIYKDKNKWIARIRVNGKYYRESYEDKTSAARAYDKLAKKYFKEFAKTNF